MNFEWFEKLGKMTQGAAVGFALFFGKQLMDKKQAEVKQERLASVVAEKVLSKIHEKE